VAAGLRAIAREGLRAIAREVRSGNHNSQQQEHPHDCLGHPR
jgi:hypothetical protein